MISKRRPTFIMASLTVAVSILLMGGVAVLANPGVRISGLKTERDVTGHSPKKAEKSLEKEAYVSFPLFFIRDNGRIDRKSAYHIKRGDLAASSTSRRPINVLLGRSGVLPEGRQIDEMNSPGRGGIIRLFPLETHRDLEIAGADRQRSNLLEEQVRSLIGKSLDGSRNVRPTGGSAVYGGVYKGFDIRLYSGADRIEYGVAVRRNTEPEGRDPATISSPLAGIPTATTTATISGTVYQTDGTTPITGTSLKVTAYTGDRCGGDDYYVSYGYINTEDGTYTITGLEPGTYYLRSDNLSSANYVDEWWADPASVIDCCSGEPITVTAGQTVSTKDFQLDTGATISGTVFQSGTTTPITGGGYVDVYTGVPGGYYGSFTYVTYANIDTSTGTYTVVGLPAGTYYLNAYPDSNYLDEWWAEPSSVTNYCDAQPISVTAGQTVPGKNFQLDPDPRATISGRVYQSDGETPITGNGYVVAYTGNPCGSYSWVGDGYIYSDGTYTISRLPTGTYYLKAFPYSTYIDEWWASSASTPDCSAAQSIPVTAGDTVIGKDFQLDTGATISGTVYQTDGTTPITGGGYVDAYTGTPCGSYYYVASGYINTSGSYSISGLYTGTYYLKTDTSNYTDEWWASSASTPDCIAAQSIPVITGQTVLGTDFQLDTGATISGTVYESDGTTPITGNGWVYAYTGDPCGSYNYAASGYIYSDGAYTITGLAAENYYLKALPYSDYTDEWWASSASTPDCIAAQSIPVTPGQTVTGKDFQLDPEPGATISGTVYQSDGTTPVTGGVYVDVYAGNPCGSNSYIGYGYTNACDGTYAITGLPAGTYYLRTYTSPYYYSAGSNYLDEWWASPSSTPDCSAAQSISVAAGETAAGKDFQLDTGATISGTVFQSDGSTPITGGGWVDVYTGDPCGSYRWVGDGYINACNGTYTITGLPTGNYYLKTYPYSNYIREWWASPLSVIDCSGAQSIPVTAGNPVTEKNFQLDTGATISGTVFQSDGTTPVTGNGYVDAYTGNPCGSYSWVGDGYIDSDGTYTITRLPAGTYFLQTYTYSNYISEWWAFPSSVIDCSNAQSILVAAEGTVTGKNFQLGTGATISGTVYQSDRTTPITGGGYVDAYTGNPCESPNYVGYGSIGSEGTYTITRLPTGIYFLKTSTSNYTDEWWADPSSVIDCAGAQSVPVTVGSPVTGKNFQLDVLPTITSFSPTSGRTGTSVIITGTSFTGTEVKFGGTAASSFTVDSETQITAVVGSGSTGKVTVTTAVGTAESSTDFSYIGTYSYPLPGGTGVVTNYRIFTVPLDLGTGADMLSAMEAVLGAYNPTRWRVFALYNGSNIELNSADFASLRIIPGMGFWIITLSSPSVDFQGILAPDGIDYEIDLSPGWHMIALPWPSTDINLGGITVTDGTSTYAITDDANTLTQKSVWDYTGSGPFSGYEKRPTAPDSDYVLKHGVGYYLKVLASSNITLIIPPNSSPAATLDKALSRKPTERGNEEPPPGFICKVGHRDKAFSGGRILPLPPDGLIHDDLPQCPQCSGAEVDRVLENKTFDSLTQCECTATESITIGKDVIIQSGANVTFKAPKINLQSGFHAEEGAVVKIKQE